MSGTFSGPWHLIEDSQGFTNIHHAPEDDGDTGDIVATCFQDDDHARLIASAPDMLAALRAALGLILTSDHHTSGAVLEKVEAAISRATGSA